MSVRVQSHKRAFVASRVTVSRYRVVPLSRYPVIAFRCVELCRFSRLCSLLSLARAFAISSFRRPSPRLGLGRCSAKSDRQRGWDRIEQRYKAGRLP